MDSDVDQPIKQDTSLPQLRNKGQQDQNAIRIENPSSTSQYNSTNNQSYKNGYTQSQNGSSNQSGSQRDIQKYNTASTTNNQSYNYSNPQLSSTNLRNKLSSSNLEQGYQQGKSPKFSSLIIHSEDTGNSLSKQQIQNLKQSQVLYPRQLQYSNSEVNINGGTGYYGGGGRYSGAANDIDEEEYSQLEKEYAHKGGLNGERTLRNKSQSQLNLIKAKQDKHQSLKFKSIKNAYAMQSRILKLKVDEEKYLRKIDNERKKAEEMARVRESYDQKMRLIKQAAMDREQRVAEHMELIHNRNSISKMFVNQNFHKNTYQLQKSKLIYHCYQLNEKISEIQKQKKQLHDEVQKEKQSIEREKMKFAESIQYQKSVNALLIKEQLQMSKQRMLEQKHLKDEQTKQSFLQRVKEERKKKRQTDKQIKQLAKLEQEMQDRVLKTQEVFKSLKPPQQVNNSNLSVSHSLKDLSRLSNNQYSYLNIIRVVNQVEVEELWELGMAIREK